MLTLPYSSFDVTVSNAIRSKDPLLLELIRYRYRYSFVTSIMEITANSVSELKIELAFEEALRVIHYLAGKGKFLDLKEFEMKFSSQFIFLFTILQNCTGQVDFLELEAEFKKKMRYYLKRNFLSAFPEKPKEATAMEIAPYIFSIDDYVKGDPAAQLFIRGLFFHPLLCFTHSITNDLEESAKIVNTVLVFLHKHKGRYTGYNVMASFMYHGCRIKAFDYLKHQHREKQHSGF